jgi:hypothetical protein
MWSDRPDRAYVAYIDGGAMIFDTSGLGAVRAGRAERFTPRLVGHARFNPPFPAWTHTFQPLPGRDLAWAADEAVQDGCADAPKLLWLVDIRDESNPVIVGSAPLRPDDGELCRKGGRFGAHNLHPNFPGPLYARLRNTIVSTWFNGGVRIYRLIDAPAEIPNAPPRIEEIGSYIPAAPPGTPTGTIQINHAIADERGLIYANDRATGGLYILRYTGPVPLD